MKRSLRLAAALLVLLPAATGRAQDEAEPATPAETAAPADTPAPAETAAPASNEPASYGIGYQIGSNLRTQGVEIDLEVLIEGLRAGATGGEPRFTAEELATAVGELQQRLVAAQQAHAAERAAAALAEGQALLAANAAREGVTVLPSGLQYEVLEAGSGERPTAEDQVVVHYQGTLPDGTVFDSSHERGQPATFPVGGVIPGFAEGLQLMAEGARYKLWIPAAIAYGERGGGPIPPNSTLVFEVQLLDVVEAAETPSPEPPAPDAAPEEPGTGGR